MEKFTGIPAAAVGFYAELEEHNNRDWWLSHKDTYDAAVRQPLEALLAGLAPVFGPAKLFRPYRDVRFSPDKSPYKTAQGAFVSSHEGVGFYLQLGADGLLVGGGFHSSSPAHLARFRSAVDAPLSGAALAGLADALTEAGFAVEGQRLKTVPRGFPKDHPRAELLKHKTLSASKLLGQPAWLDTAGAREEVARHWEQLRPLVDWTIRYAAP
ncbi:DUF2461 domain-containing protein [Arthrobacter sp. SDTb3-6]|uniref:DUF2461 domain-containing protein n=1 Tax=Arthrobacter sp. SDTb3-6 TaxID=2713571 RepID=UPI00159D7208|nr:DUF2461 domain-containing protein [Arthrobacter sp. SDTb3-6]NVM97074.1 DUF2461 domain-containing protein [Arthrobacter sp. SDTb3-6]